MAEPQQQAQTPTSTPTPKGAAAPAQTPATRGMTKQTAATSAEGYDAQAALLVPPPPGGKAGASGQAAGATAGNKAAAPATLDPKERAAAEVEVRAAIRANVAAAWLEAVEDLRQHMPGLMQAEIKRLTGGLDPQLVITNTRQLMGAADQLAELDLNEFKRTALEKTTGTPGLEMNRAGVLEAAKKTGEITGTTIRSVLGRLERGTFTKQDIFELIAARAKVEGAYSSIAGILDSAETNMEWVVSGLSGVVRLAKGFFDLTEQVPLLKAASLAAKGAIDLAGAFSESANGIVPESIGDNVAKATVNFVADTLVGELLGNGIDTAANGSPVVSAISDRIGRMAAGRLRSMAKGVAKSLAESAKSQVTSRVAELLKAALTDDSGTDLTGQMKDFGFDFVKTAFGEAKLIDLFTAMHK